MARHLRLQPHRKRYRPTLLGRRTRTAWQVAPSAFEVRPRRSIQLRAISQTFLFQVPLSLSFVALPIRMISEVTIAVTAVFAQFPQIAGIFNVVNGFGGLCRLCIPYR